MSKDPHNIILAIDTALNGCSACVFDSEKDESFVSSRAMPRGQAEHLVPMVQDVMDQGGYAFDQVDAIVTTIGPGAFTGLRIGLSTARSFGLALNKSVYGLTTFQVLAHSYLLKNNPNQSFTALIETKRKDFYMQNFSAAGVAESVPSSLIGNDVFDRAHGVLIGDAVSRFMEERSAYAGAYVSGYELPDVNVMARLFVQQPALFAKDPVPLYLRGPDVSQPKKKPRILAEV